MPPTVIRDFAQPLVEIRQAWSDPWVPLAPGELQVLRGANYVPSVGLDFMSFQSRYGRVKLPTEDSIEVRDPLTLDGWWVRVSVYEPPEENGDIEGEWIQIFQGRFESQLRSPAGKMFDAPPTGLQAWTAYGGYKILQRAAIHSHTTQRASGEVYELSYVASPNLPFGGSDEWFANRGDDLQSSPSEHYVFADYRYEAVRKPWSSLDVVRYLIARHLPPPGDGENPTWTVVGQTDAIESLTEGIPLEDPTDVATVLHNAIPRSAGVDFVVVPTDDGFAISVFSLATADSEFEATSLPANPHVFSLDASSLVDTQIQIENTSVQRFRKIVVRGERLVCCATFGVGEGSRPALHPDWSESREEGYKLAAGDTAADAEFNDTCRTSGAFMGVYQWFAASDDATGGEVNINPRVDEIGFVRYEDSAEPIGSALRSTLDWVPLRANVDYQSLSPYESAEIGERFEPGDGVHFRPLVFVPLVTTGDPSHFKSAEALGIEIAPLTGDIGVSLRCDPPHLIASGDFTIGAAGTNPTLVRPQYDFRKFVVTLAYPGSHRLQLVSIDEEADESFGTKVIDVPGAQCWYVAEGTVYGSDPSDATAKGLLATTQPLIVRDDRERLARAMAGAIARYRRNRYRARIQIRGLAIWHWYLGQLIEAINDGTEDTATLRSPVTGVEWEFESSFATTVRTGYAE